jgi:probable rRNA maturation factor
MNEPGPTDVLAFPMDELHDQRDDVDDEGDAPPTLLGDVVLCPEIASRQALQAGHGTEDELHLLCTHGVLHLLGYDHAEPAEEREMFATQTRLLQSWAQARRG